ncbi:hypothetical protein SNK04_004531 [Fusarium graminearum]
MSSIETTKPQAIRAIETTLFTLDQTQSSCSLPEGISSIPEAFVVVARSLPVTRELFRSVKAQLEPNQEETDQMVQMYPIIKQVDNESCKQLRSIQDLFDIIKQDKHSEANLEHYALAVKRSGGKKVETIMEELLTTISDVVVEPLVTPKEMERLREVFEEVKRIPPSLRDDLPASIHLTNTGSGNQFHNSGKGNQNNCSGGFQVNGNHQNSQFSYAEKSKEDRTQQRN